jgi:hypothetical protein
MPRQACTSSGFLPLRMFSRSERVQRHGSHRRGHWFYPSIADHLYLQVDSHLPESLVIGRSLVAHYFGSELGAGIGAAALVVGVVSVFIRLDRCRGL